MRNKRSKAISFTWLKLVFIVLIIVFLALFTYFVLTYNALQKSKHAGFDKTNKFVSEETDIVQINHTERFQELDEYHIVFGKTDDKTEQIVFVQTSNPTENITIINQADIMEKETIEKQWQSNCKQCKLIATKPAFLGDTPLWELTYYDEKNRYVFDYVSMYDGSEFEKVRLKRKFK